MNLFDYEPAVYAGQQYVPAKRGKKHGVHDTSNNRFAPFVQAACAKWAAVFCNKYPGFAAKIEWDELKPGEVL